MKTEIQKASNEHILYNLQKSLELLTEARTCLMRYAYGEGPSHEDITKIINQARKEIVWEIHHYKKQETGV